MEKTTVALLVNKFSEFNSEQHTMRCLHKVHRLTTGEASMSNASETSKRILIKFSTGIL
jgi:hypothetical protein